MTASVPTAVGALAHLYQVEVVRHPNQLAPDVQGLMEQAERRCSEFGIAWFRNLATTVYPDSQNLRFFVVRREGKVLAVLPLRAEKSGLGWDFHALGNFYTTLYEPLFAPECSVADLAPLLTAMRADLPGLGALRLSPMDPTAPSYKLILDALRGSRWRPFEFFSFGNWYQPVTGSWDEYLAMRSGTLRSTIKRMTKKFNADGGTIEIVTDAGDVPRAMEAYERVYACSWKQAEPYSAFMPGLARTCADQGFLRLGVAWLDGKPIAAQLWIVAHGRAEIYKVAYDESSKAYAPGTLLTARLMEHVIEVDKVAEVDYLIGDDPYKKTWMSHRRERWGIIAYNPRSLMGVAGWMRECLGRALKDARAHLLHAVASRSSFRWPPRRSP